MCLCHSHCTPIPPPQHSHLTVTAVTQGLQLTAEMTKGLSLPLSHSPAALQPPPSSVPSPAPSSPAPSATQEGTRTATTSLHPMTSGSPRWSRVRKSQRGRTHSRPLPPLGHRGAADTAMLTGKGTITLPCVPQPCPALWDRRGEIRQQGPNKTQPRTHTHAPNLLQDTWLSLTIRPSSFHVGRAHSDPTQVQSPISLPHSHSSSSEPARCMAAPELKEHADPGGSRGDTAAGMKQLLCFPPALPMHCSHPKPRAGWAPPHAASRSPPLPATAPACAWCRHFPLHALLSGQHSCSLWFYIKQTLPASSPAGPGNRAG